MTGTTWRDNGFKEQALDDGSPFYCGCLPEELLWDDHTFEEVWRLHPTTKPRIRMINKEVEIPRWQQAYGADYHFSGQTSRALPAPRCCCRSGTGRGRPLIPGSTGSCSTGMRGRPTTSAHHDSTRGMAAGAPIVTVSFGETRVFRLSRGSGAVRRVRDFPAPAGTVFILPQDTNEVWKHAVPKSGRHRGRRISVTLRAFEAALSEP